MIQPLRNPFKDIVEATNNFDENNLLKQGGKAYVYKGVLQRWLGDDVEEDVVIRKYRRNNQFNFYEELHKIYVFQFRDFISFYGFCDQDGERITVLESLVNGSLSRYLSYSTLTWFEKLSTCCNAADELIRWNRETKIKDHLNYGVTEDYSSDMYCLSGIMLGVIYGGKVTIEDVNQYVEYNYEERKRVGDMIPSDLKTQIKPRSLSSIKSINLYVLE